LYTVKGTLSRKKVCQKSVLGDARAITAA
jgi:hypothetical protein